MFYVSDIYAVSPKKFDNELQEKIYNTLEKLNVSYERIETDEAITMDDCIAINKKLDMKMVKTLFLCNRQETKFYLFITCANKKFDSKKFSHELNIARVSFAKEELMNSMLGTQIGAATIFSSLIDLDCKIQIVIDKDVINEEYYGCSDGTTTGYMKIKTDDIINKILPYSKHEAIIVDL